MKKSRKRKKESEGYMLNRFSRRCCILEGGPGETSLCQCSNYKSCSFSAPISACLGLKCPALVKARNY